MGGEKGLRKGRQGRDEARERKGAGVMGGEGGEGKVFLTTGNPKFNSGNTVR